MSPDGTPIQVNASALQAAAAQNGVGQGMLTIKNIKKIHLRTRIVNK